MTYGSFPPVTRNKTLIVTLLEKAYSLFTKSKNLDEMSSDNKTIVTLVIR